MQNASTLTTDSRSRRVASDAYSNHGLPIGAVVTPCEAPDWASGADGSDWYTLGGVGDEVAIDARDLEAVLPENTDNMETVERDLVGTVYRASNGDLYRLARYDVPDDDYGMPNAVELPSYHYLGARGGAAHVDGPLPEGVERIYIPSPETKAETD